MRKYIIASLLIGSSLAIGCTPGSAGMQESQRSASPTKASLDAAINADIRGDDQQRDDQRHPAETLNFFQLADNMTVGEYAPGGGWYTKILAPYLADQGRYIALGITPDNIPGISEDRKTNMAGFSTNFPEETSKKTGLDTSKLTAYITNNVPDGMHGGFDRILIFRMMHNVKRWGIADGELQAMKKLLKPGGMIGIVQHRAKASAPDDYADGNKGYLKQDDVIAMMEKNGFALAAKSEVNANANDSADYPKGVWTLPPVFAEGDTDKDKYQAIGESDRMTLLFKIASE